MIDTVKFHQCLLVQARREAFADTDTWYSEHRQIDATSRQGHPVPLHRRLLVHKPTGLRAQGTEDMLDTFEVSLPKVLFGHNGKLLKSQCEIDAAIGEMHALMGQIGELSDDLPEFKRVDFVWQFRGDPELFILAHQHARHNRIRRDVVRFEKGSLTWRGSDRSVCIYDKCREMFRVPGEVVRVEVRLRGRVLEQMLGPKPVSRLNFGICYEVYRNMLLGFRPLSVAGVSNIAEFLALAEREGWKSGDVSAFDIYCHRLGQRQRRRLQKQIAEARQKIFGFDWPDLLPPDHPSAPVEVSGEMLNDLSRSRRQL